MLLLVTRPRAANRLVTSALKAAIEAPSSSRTRIASADAVDLAIPTESAHLIVDPEGYLIQQKDH